MVWDQEGCSGVVTPRVGEGEDEHSSYVTDDWDKRQYSDPADILAPTC